MDSDDYLTVSQIYDQENYVYGCAARFLRRARRLDPEPSIRSAAAGSLSSAVAVS